MRSVNRVPNLVTLALLINVCFVFCPPCRDGSRDIVVLGSHVLVIDCNTLNAVFTSSESTVKAK
jgi:hypothetical protein